MTIEVNRFVQIYVSVQVEINVNFDKNASHLSSNCKERKCRICRVDEFGDLFWRSIKEIFGKRGQLGICNGSVVSLDFAAGRARDVVRFERTCAASALKSQNVSRAFCRNAGASPGLLANYTSFIDQGQAGNDH